ncbi:MAG: signal peptidase I [Firmicutes bacterium]|nr:signal peptidase I [Bacillota bacterium]
MSGKNLTQVIRESLENQGEETALSITREIFSWFLIIAGAIGVALLLNRFIIVNAQVTSSSMSNTIQTWDRVLGLRVDYWFKSPQRGDVIFFLNPDDESVIYVKRVIGTPGDTVEIRGGTTYINGEALDEPYLAEPAADLDFGPYNVPEGYYFFLGDNRNNSRDSRYLQHTYVSEDKILGKAYWVYYPRLQSITHSNEK